MYVNWPASWYGDHVTNSWGKDWLISNEGSLQHRAHIDHMYLTWCQMWRQLRCKAKYPLVHSCLPLCCGRVSVINQFSSVLVWYIQYCASVCVHFAISLVMEWECKRITSTALAQMRMHKWIHCFNPVVSDRCHVIINISVDSFSSVLCRQRQYQVTGVKQASNFLGIYWSNTNDYNFAKLMSRIPWSSIDFAQ